MKETAFKFIICIKLQTGIGTKVKQNEIKRFLGMERQDQFHIMGENVRDFIQEDITVINEFLNRENLRGDSAGLALGLSAMVHQGSLLTKFQSVSLEH